MPDSLTPTPLNTPFSDTATASPAPVTPSVDPIPTVSVQATVPVQPSAPSPLPPDPQPAVPPAPQPVISELPLAQPTTEIAVPQTQETASLMPAIEAPITPAVPVSTQPAPAVPETPALASTVNPDPLLAQALQGMPAPDPLSSSRGKEWLPAQPISTTELATPVANTVEQPQVTPEMGSVATPESEPAKELEPEVEKTVERMKQHKATPPAQVAVAADTMPVAPPPTVSQPVVVLPLTEKAMQSGSKKSVNNSIRWLYQWCTRQVQKFTDILVVYRDNDA